MAAYKVTTVSIRMPNDVLQNIDDMAAKDYSTRTSMIIRLLTSHPAFVGNLADQGGEKTWSI